MDFVKKNWGLLLFLVITLGVVVYLVMGILAAQAKLEESQKKQQGHLEVINNVRKSGKRIDEENQEKAGAEAGKAKAQYKMFHDRLVEKQLLPGVDMMIDLDDESATAATAEPEPELDEDGNPLPRKPKVDPYKDLPYRKLFDGWMQMSLLDARNQLMNVLIELNDTAFKGADEDAQANQAAAEGRAPGAEARKPKADAKDKDANKSVYDAQKERRRRIVKGNAIPEFFMFEEYVRNRASGLHNKKERRNVFRQFLLLKTLCRYLQQAEVTELVAIDFPCGLEILDSDKYLSTPISMTINGKPECIEAFLNLLNAGEDYIFYLKDITSLTATVQLNDDPLLAFNGTQEPASTKLTSFLANTAAGTGTTQSVGGGEGGFMGGGRRRRGAAAAETTSRARNLPVGNAMGGGGEMTPVVALPKTRKAYRIFASKSEEPAPASTRGDAMNPAGQGSSVANTAERGTSVQISLLFEQVEFKPLAE